MTKSNRYVLIYHARKIKGENIRVMEDSPFQKEKEIRKKKTPQIGFYVQVENLQAIPKNRKWYNPLRYVLGKEYFNFILPSGKII